MKTPYLRSAYTLIELMIVVSIIAILSTLVYAPYSYYQNIAKVRNASDRIMQSFSDARIAAASGLSFSGIEGNLDTAVILEKGSGKIEVQGIVPGKSFFDTPNIRPIRTISLENNVSIVSFSGAAAVWVPIIPTLPNRIGVRYVSPTGIAKFYSLDTNPETEIPEISGGVVSLHGATSGTLAVPFNLKTY